MPRFAVGLCSTHKFASAHQQVIDRVNSLYGTTISIKPHDSGTMKQVEQQEMMSMDEFERMITQIAKSVAENNSKYNNMENVTTNCYKDQTAEERESEIVRNYTCTGYGVENTVFSVTYSADLLIDNNGRFYADTIYRINTPRATMTSTGYFPSNAWYEGNPYISSLISGGYGVEHIFMGSVKFVFLLNIIDSGTFYFTARTPEFY